MRRFKSTFFHLTAWSRTSTQRTARAIRSIRSAGYPAQATWSAFWSMREAEQPRRTLPVNQSTVRPLRTITQQPADDRIRQTISGFLLWFGLLFSAALIGTFIVIGTVVVYALVMSLIGH